MISAIVLKSQEFLLLEFLLGAVILGVLFTLMLLPFEQNILTNNFWLCDWDPQISKICHQTYNMRNS